MAEMLAKNFTITHAMRSKIASLGSRLLKGDVRQQKQHVKDILDDEPDLVEPTLLLLQRGLMYDFLGNIKRRLPTACTKSFLVPLRTMTKFVVTHSFLSLSDLKTIRKRAASDKVNILERIFCFGTRHDREDPITEHNEDAFLTEMECRHTAAGEPLQGLKMSGQAIDWGLAVATAWPTPRVRACRPSHMCSIARARSRWFCARGGVPSTQVFPRACGFPASRFAQEGGGGPRSSRHSRS